MVLTRIPIAFIAIPIRERNSTIRNCNEPKTLHARLRQYTMDTKKKNENHFRVHHTPANSIHLSIAVHFKCCKYVHWKKIDWNLLFSQYSELIDRKWIQSIKVNQSTHELCLIWHTSKKSNEFSGHRINWGFLFFFCS